MRVENQTGDAETRKREEKKATFLWQESLAPQIFKSPRLLFDFKSSELHWKNCRKAWQGFLG